MKENKYDDNIFFQKYSQMSRSQQGLAGAGEWETLRKLLPDFKDKRVFGIFFRFIFKSFNQFYSFLFVNAISIIAYVSWRIGDQQDTIC